MSNKKKEKSKSVMKGSIYDEEKNPIPGVAVTLIGPELPGKLCAITNEEGHFTFRSILPGTYTVIAVLGGFATIEKKGIRVAAGKTKVVNLLMKMGVIEEEITVTATSPYVYQPQYEYLDEEAKETISPVLNKKFDEAISQLSIGKILFNPPEEMKVGIKERIEVRISQDIKTDLTKRLKGKGIPRVNEIIVGAVMKVKLSGDTFKIEPLSEEEQLISSSGYTQWEWDVTPLKSGNRLIHLSVSVSIYLDKYGEKTKSLPVLERGIYVKVNLRYNFLSFIKKYWPWIVTTIIALIALYLTFKGLKK